MRALTKSRVVLVGAAVLATAGMSACSANSGIPSSAGSGNGHSTPASATAAQPTATAAATASAGAPGPTTGQGAIQNLVISSAEKTELTTAYTTTYAAGLRVPVADLGAPALVPGSVFYAYDPATDTYWAMADFGPTAPFSDPTAYMDGTSRGLFTKVGAGAWQVTIPINPDICEELRFFPPAVLAVWSISTAAPADATC